MKVAQARRGPTIEEQLKDKAWERESSMAAFLFQRLHSIIQHLKKLVTYLTTSQQDLPTNIDETNKALVKSDLCNGEIGATCPYIPFANITRYNAGTQLCHRF